MFYVIIAKHSFTRGVILQEIIIEKVRGNDS